MPTRQLPTDVGELAHTVRISLQIEPPLLDQLKTRRRWDRAYAVIFPPPPAMNVKHLGWRILINGGECGKEAGKRTSVLSSLVISLALFPPTSEGTHTRDLTWSLFMSSFNFDSGNSNNSITQQYRLYLSDETL